MNRSSSMLQGGFAAVSALPRQLNSLCPMKIDALRQRAALPQAQLRTATAPVLNISQLDRAAAAPSRTSPVPARTPAYLPQEPKPLLAHEIVKGALVRYSTNASVESRPPPTAVLVHGILGSRRNMQSFARRLVEGFPSWQVVLVDLRCHGDSAPLTPALPEPHSVDAAAGDVLRLLSALKLFPEILIGHSFGGKVVMSMAHQFGKSVRRLPRPVRVWALDSLPGQVRSGEMGAADRPADLITTLQRIPLPITSRADLTTRLEAAGFSAPVAGWAATNLTPVSPAHRELGFTWSFDLDGIAQMYRSYEDTDLWPLLAAPAEGVQLAFVKAERSTFRWGGCDEERIRALGHPVHELHNSGHWVHTDNPDGLFDILAPSFGGNVDLHLQRLRQ